MNLIIRLRFIDEDSTGSTEGECVVGIGGF